MLYHFSRIVKDFFSYLQKFAIRENESASRLIFLFVGLAGVGQAKNRRTRRRKNIFLKLFLKLYFCIFIISITHSQTKHKPYKNFCAMRFAPGLVRLSLKIGGPEKPPPAKFSKNFFAPFQFFNFPFFQNYFSE